MDIILLANHVYAIPLLQQLASQKLLGALVVPATDHAGNQQLIQVANQWSIPVLRVSKNDMKKVFSDWLLNRKPDLVLSFTFSFKVPSTLLTVPRLGIINVHFSSLPNFRGSFPVFWQLKNGDPLAGVTIHQMDEDWDTGDILLQRELQVGHGETQGLLTARLTMLAMEMIAELLPKLGKEQLPLQKQLGSSAYFRKPTIEDYTIDWLQQDSKQIENLVNACNPEVGGAITLFRGQLLRILEVERLGQAEDQTLAPGTVAIARPE